MRPGLLAALALVLGGTTAAVLRREAGLDMGTFQACMLAAGAGWIAAVRLGARTGQELRLVLWLTLVLRVLAAMGAPGLTDDPYRYEWEARVVASGRSPYALAPDHPDLEDLRAGRPELAALVGHPSIPAVYPPLAQAWHLALVSLAGEARAGADRLLPFRLGAALLDLLVLVPLLSLARGRPAQVRALVGWGTCPLVVVSFAGSGHVDVLAVLLLLGALALLRRPLVSGSLLALGAAAKLLPALAAPLLLRGTARVARGRWVLGFVGAGALAVGWVPLLEGGGRELVGGLPQYGLRWEGGSLVFRWVDRAVRALGPEGDPRLVARRLVGLVWVLLAVLEWRRRRDPVASTGVLLGAWIVLSPVLHPWYLTWALPFVLLDPRGSWLLLVALGPLLWWPVEGWQERGEWLEPAWLWQALALPFLLLRGYERLRQR